MQMDQSPAFRGDLNIEHPNISVSHDGEMNEAMINAVNISAENIIMQTTQAEVTLCDTALGEVLGMPGFVEEKPAIEEGIAVGVQVKGKPASVDEKLVIVKESQVIIEDMSVVTNRIPNCTQEMPTVVDKLLADSDRALAVENITANTSGMYDVDRIPAVADEIPERLHKLPAVDETPDVVNEISDIVDEIPGVSVVVGGISEVVDKTSSAVDAMPAVQETPFSVEKGKLCTRPEDKTLLDLIGRASPDPAIEFIKEVRSFSQAALDVALILACQRSFKYLVQKLVHLGADIECRDASGKTPLLICVENHYFDLVRFLVAKRADVKAVDCAGNNALILSISYAGSKEMTLFLLAQSGITINHQNKEGYTAVMKALEVRDVDTVKLLLEGYHPQNFNEHPYHKCEDSKAWTLLDQTVNCKGETSQEIAEKYGLEDVFKLIKECHYKQTSPLLAAVESSDLEMVTFLLDSEIKSALDMENSIAHLLRERSENEVKAFTKIEVAIIKRLLECGVNVEIHSPSYYRHSYVCIAVDVGDYNVVELLCKHGAPLNEHRFGTDELPLSVAAKHGRVDLIELLLKYRADVKTRDFRYSPLHCALIYGHIDCARVLINHGALFDIGSALASAVMNQSPKCVKFLFQHFKSEIIQYFIKKPNNGDASFIDAVQRGNLEIIELILQAGIDINKPVSEATAIVESKNGEVAQFLINCGANVNHVTSITNETPLMHVLMYRNDPCTSEVVRVLLENGASIHAKTSNMTTPLMLAARVEGREVILQTLLEHGADCSDKDKDGNTALVHAIVTLSPKNTMFLIQFMKNNTDLLNLQNNVSDSV